MKEAPEARRPSAERHLVEAARLYVQACGDRDFSKSHGSTSDHQRKVKRAEGTKRDLLKAAEKYAQWKIEERKRTKPIVPPALQRYGEGFEHKLSEVQLAAVAFIARTPHDRANLKVSFNQATFEVLQRRGYIHAIPHWMFTSAGTEFYNRMCVQCEAALNSKIGEKNEQEQVRKTEGARG